MGKTRDLFKKISDTKGIFHAKMGTIKDRNGTCAHMERTEEGKLSLFRFSLAAEELATLTLWTWCVG